MQEDTELTPEEAEYNQYIDMKNAYRLESEQDITTKVECHETTRKFNETDPIPYLEEISLPYKV